MTLDQLSVPLDPGYARGDALVEPSWLRAHLNDPGLRVIEVDVSRAAYDAGHIEGAVLWTIYTDLKDLDYRFVGSGAFENLVRRSGITLDTNVVFYGYAPAMGLWLMRLFGHPDVRILNCSRKEWERTGASLTPARPDIQVTDYRLPAPQASIRSSLPQVLAAIDDRRCVIADVRSDAEFEGQAFWPSGGTESGGRAGHVPSALHVPVDAVYDERGAFREAAALRAAFAALASPQCVDARVITYCTIGGRASTAWFVLTDLLGRDGVSVYEGSWAEWGRTQTTPVARP
jgi:thiosulfate/3-mercaptopyruvate sulfurtransferase